MKEKKAKNLEPEENVRYTFRIASKDKSPYLAKYHYFGNYNINGLTRYRMYDVTNGYFVYMSPTKFTRLMETALVEKVPVETIPIPEEQLEMTLPNGDGEGGGVCNS